MHPIEGALRAVVIFECGLLFAVFARLHRPDHVAALGMALAGSVVAFAITSAPGATAALGMWLWPLTAWCVAKPALLWLFSRAIFADRYRLGAQELSATLALVGLGLWHESTQQTGASERALLVSTWALNGASLAFLVRVPWELWRDQRSDLDPERRRVRQIVLPVGAAYLGITLLWQSIAFVGSYATPMSLRLANLVILGIAALALLGSFVRVDVADWLRLAAARPVPVLTTHEHAVLTRLQQRMAQPRWYADPGLTMATLSRNLATNEQSLRQVLQAALGYRHFTDFLHQFRLREVKARLSQSQDDHCSILTLALEAGFRSIGPFNRAFKAAEGCTPSEYRQRARTHASQVTSFTSSGTG